MSINMSHQSQYLTLNDQLMETSKLFILKYKKTKCLDLKIKRSKSQI